MLFFVLQILHFFIYKLPNLFPLHIIVGSVVICVLSDWSGLVKLTVGIISGFGEVNAEIFGKSCNCQKTGTIGVLGQIH